MAGVNFQKDHKKVFKFLSDVKNEGGLATRQPLRVYNKSIISDVEIAKAFVKHFAESHHWNRHARVSSKLLKRDIK